MPEVLAWKQEAFRHLDAVLKPEAVVATNTSSLGVLDVAVSTHRPDRVLGFHFFNPAPVMQLVEMITTVFTDPQVVEVAREFATAIGKTPVVVKDRAGFIANLLLFPYLNQAVEMVETGYATKEDVDAAMQLGTGHPIGPLALVDLIGIDSTNSIMERMYEQFRDVRYAPRPIIRQLLAAGSGDASRGAGSTATRSPTPRAPSPTRVSSRPPSTPRSIAGWTQVGVLGTGTMASGIAEVCAKAGYDVVLRGRTVDKAEKAIEAVAKSLGKAVDKGKLEPEARDEVLARITPTDGLASFADCDLVIEAVAEELEVKRELLRRARQAHEAGRRPGHDHVQPARRSPARWRPPGPSASSACTSSTRPRSCAWWRSSRPCAPTPRSSSRPARSTERVGKHAGALRRPRRVHRQRAALPVPQRRQSACSWTGTPAPRTSTPR